MADCVPYQGTLKGLTSTIGSYRIGVGRCHRIYLARFSGSPESFWGSVDFQIASAPNVRRQFPDINPLSAAALHLQGRVLVCALFAHRNIRLLVRSLDHINSTCLSATHHPC
jgi:hypothetical protein